VLNIMNIEFARVEFYYEKDEDTSKYKLYITDVNDTPGDSSMWDKEIVNISKSLFKFK